MAQSTALRMRGSAESEPGLKSAETSTSRAALAMPLYVEPRPTAMAAAQLTWLMAAALLYVPRECGHDWPVELTR